MKDIWHTVASNLKLFLLPNRVLGLVFLGLGCEGLVVLRHFLRVPIESSENGVWGFPATRVMILAGLCFFTLAFLLIAVLSWLKPSRAAALIAFASQDPGKKIFAFCLTALIFIWMAHLFSAGRAQDTAGGRPWALSADYFMDYPDLSPAIGGLDICLEKRLASAVEIRGEERKATAFGGRPGHGYLTSPVGRNCRHADWNDTG